VGSGALQRPKREDLLAAVRRRELDAIVVWRLDRWGRSLADCRSQLMCRLLAVYFHIHSRAFSLKFLND
jgi:DNA invertase Pin-like site-specific DNA recombinase